MADFARHCVLPLLLPLAPTSKTGIRSLSAAREAALADEAGKALDATLALHGAAPRPVKAQPIG